MAPIYVVNHCACSSITLNDPQVKYEPHYNEPVVCAGKVAPVNKGGKSCQG